MNMNMSSVAEGGGGGNKEDGGEFPTISFLSAVELQVFKTFIKNYKATRTISNDDAIALHAVFGPMIQQVFEFLEEENVVIHQSSVRKRVLIEVMGRDRYWIPPGHSVCQCMSYTHGKKEFCKHVLAAHLYLAIFPKGLYKEMKEEEMSEIFMEHLED